ncbi:hypothetical protein JCM5353_003681 [Sporobolomyces roseus]
MLRAFSKRREPKQAKVQPLSLEEQEKHYVAKCIETFVHEFGIRILPMPGALADSARDLALRHVIETYKVDLDTLTLEFDEDGDLSVYVHGIVRHMCSMQTNPKSPRVQTLTLDPKDTAFVGPRDIVYYLSPKGVEKNNNSSRFNDGIWGGQSEHKGKRNFVTSTDDLWQFNSSHRSITVDWWVTLNRTTIPAQIESRLPKSFHIEFVNAFIPQAR